MIKKRVFTIIFAIVFSLIPNNKNIKSASINYKSIKSNYISRNNVNSKKYLDIKTYDKSNQSNHPKVIFVNKPWNGYRYWMSYTPYPFSKSQFENPSIVVSNDGVNWIVPKGLRQPLISPPYDAKFGGHYSDSNLVMNSNNNTMELWYRYNKGTKMYNPDGSIDYIYRVISKDGINWSKPQLVYSGKELCISPAIIYENNKYKMWYVTYMPRIKIRYRESVNGVLWSNCKDINIKYDKDCYPWHIDVTKTEIGYEMLISNYYKSFGNNILSYTLSKDGLNFNKTVDIIYPSKNINAWDNKMIYRSSLVKVNGFYKYTILR
ncbi:hypothetical protein CLOACE_07570 [Clostridium acetireducens DSM 10703]|uniref:Uncharacterized protein n=1 Tax=Clostridium acetireducens DSM 10703 TaxID=1121290 RepID=A0A1E8F020_9CLOT|nr:hypothetical protein [Clostridium acetireducens]OFI06774.1 hypothetical protein CLOACE_07570 [Clostridium acetireducens DSM 10703]